MSTTPEDKPRAGPDFLFPLQRHTRTEAVTAQLTEMGRLPRHGVLRRAADTGANRLALEALIAVIRAYLRAGDEEAADTVLEHLTARLRGPISAKAASWTTIAPADREDAAGEAGLRLLGYVRNLSPAEEFWECNFTHCFTQRMSTILSSLSRAKQPTVSLSGTDDERGERDGLANLPDTAAHARFTDFETREIVAALEREVPQIRPYLFLAREGYTDEEIALQLQVTTRTLRNWKDKARRWLAREGRT